MLVGFFVIFRKRWQNNVAMIVLFLGLVVMAVHADNLLLNQPFVDSFTKLTHSPCVSVFHRNGRSGCSTSSSSSNKHVGQLVLVNQAELPNVQQNFVAVVPEPVWDADMVNALVAGKGGFLQGILVVNATQSSSSSNTYYYSPAGIYPQGTNTPSVNINPYPDYAWNQNGQGLLHYDLYGLPVAYVADSNVADSLVQIPNNNNNVVAEWDYYMGPADMDSLDCLAWHDDHDGDWSPKCLPLGGSSVWATSDRIKQNAEKDTVILATNLDAPSFFYGAVPAANAAASNIVATLLAAKLVGQYAPHSLNRRMVVAFFQGEAYGMVGSRRFLQDVDYFSCSQSAYTVPRMGSQSDQACVNPVRPDLQFTQLGDVVSMIAVDQVGHALADGTLYAHADKNDDEWGAFYANVMKASATQYVSVSASSVQADDDTYPLPPTPVSSLASITGINGAVLAGYDYYYSNAVPYASHHDNAHDESISLTNLAGAATIAARTLVAAAYDDGSFDSDTASAYAVNLIPELSSKDETLVALADCLIFGGDCGILSKYSQAAVATDRSRSGLSYTPQSFDGNFHAGVFYGRHGQPMVRVGDKEYGVYDKELKSGDAVVVQPNELETAVAGLLDDFLGRHSDDLVSCNTPAQCRSVEYCGSSNNKYQFGNGAVCAASGVCVCQSAHYHVAYDENLQATEQVGYFEVVNGNVETPLYTEPNWSNTVGVSVYRQAEAVPGILSLGAGVLVSAVSVFGAFCIRLGLTKEKLL